MKRIARQAVVACITAACAWNAAATTVEVISLGPRGAELIVDGQAVRSLRVGQTSPEGVELVSVDTDRAALNIDGRRHEMRLGEINHPSVVLRADAQGHFFAAVQINGRTTRMLVDTGASSVGLSAEEAGRLGIAYRLGREVRLQTASGPVSGYAVMLDAVPVEGIALSGVEAVVLPAPGALSVGVLGMSFLRRVQMIRAGDTLTLNR